MIYLVIRKEEILTYDAGWDHTKEVLGAYSTKEKAQEAKEKLDARYHSQYIEYLIERLSIQ